MISSWVSTLTKWQDLTLNLITKEIRVRYMGAALGFFWSLGNPLIATLTYYTVFTYILPSNQDRFALHLVTGVIHWMLLSQLLTQSCEWLINNSNLIRKLRFPRILLPLSSALTVGVFWGVAMAVYAFLFPFLGGVITQAIFWYPIVLLSFIALIFGIGLAFSVLQISIRDIKHLVDVIVPLLFWLTPIVWMTASLPPAVASIVAFNPLAPYFNSFAAIFHSGVAPATADLAICISLGSASMLTGLVVFRKADQMADSL